jgi:vacuolar-type H+-ATPase subunit F/Vma7
MGRAVALGEKEFILGLKGAGFEIISCRDAAGFRKALGALARESDAALVLVTETMAGQAMDALDEFRVRSTAILSIIPTHEGGKGLSFQVMKKTVELSIGVDVLGKE